MNAMLVLLIGAAVLVVGYIFYGGWLAKQWGVNADRVTPAHEFEDGVDYVPAKPYVVLGHHFSSIAGAGPINGPIQAAVFGWVPVLLWVLIGGIFFGAMHDFGALFASLRHKGQTLASVIQENIDDTAKKLFCIFAYLTLILVVAAFASIVAGTFAVVPNADGVVEMTGTNLANSRTAMISVLFIVAAVIWGIALRGRSIPGPVNIALAIVVIVAVVTIGYNFPIFELNNFTWMWIVGAYILVASVAPVWILLQPRDYLSSYLLYGMIALALVGIIGAGVTGAATNLDIPAFTGFTAVKGDSKVATTGFLFPALFITIACGAISGFHSLVASGTTSKQLDHESEAQPIAYGGMLLECLVAIISLCAVAFVFDGYMDGTYASPTQVFAGGLSQMLGCIPGLSGAEDIAYSLLILAVSVFCLTSLDTATRLGRYMFQELFIPAGKAREELSGWRKFFSNPVVATLITVTLGVALGLTGYQLVWPLFGAANQLLAALGLLAVCAWLGNAGRNNKMFYVPMVFMLIVTLTSLVLTMQAKFLAIAGGALTLANGLQLVLAVLLAVLAVVLAIKGARVIFGNKKKEIAE
ncbi:carbon starvation CstA family protein [Slackia isoflavoniconvertens]|uniref:carbon starvation CstA family protein n=1 Tax=Slackia isoflavoniconvertens TaxID=572010 RepID=UPI003076B32C